jgi:hypothetical protein
VGLMIFFFLAWRDARQLWSIGDTSFERALTADSLGRLAGPNRVSGDCQERQHAKRLI